MKRNSRKIRNFTLVELLVAMAVFSLLVMLMLQFFTGAQKLWTSTEQRNDLYANARVAMDLMSTLIQNTYYSSSGGYGMPFVIDNSEENASKIYFPTQTRMEGISGENSIRFVGFQRGTGTNTNHLLIMTFFSDDDDNGEKAFSCFFPPYDAGFLANQPNIQAAFESACEKLVEILNDENGKGKPSKTLTATELERGNYRENKDYAVLLDTVTGLSFYAQEYSTSTQGISYKSSNYGSLTIGVPYLVEIRLSMMDKKNFEIWDKDYNGRTATGAAKDKADAFRQQHEHTFTRAVFIGDRTDHTTL